MPKNRIGRKNNKISGTGERKMGKGALAIGVLVILVAVAIGIFITGVEAEEEGGTRLGLSFGAIVILICFVFFLAVYLAHARTRRFYIVT
jgi:cation transporter-like permease